MHILLLAGMLVQRRLWDRIKGRTHADCSSEHKDLSREHDEQANRFARHYTAYQFL